MKQNKIIYFTAFLILILSACSNTTSSSSLSSSSSQTPSSSSEPSSQPSSEPSSEPSSSDPSTSVTKMLDTPVLSLDENNGLVTFEPIENATCYRYYTNNNEIKTTINTSIQLESGSTLAVMAFSEDENYRSSTYSDPVTYFAKEQDETNIYIYFHNTELKPITILKGSTYTPTTPKKDQYTFDGWYLDPYYQEKLTPDHIFNDNTILYASFIAEDWFKDTTFFIKANPLISSTIISTSSSSSGWRFIPLSLDKDETTKYNKNIYSATISVKNASTASSADYIIMDGIEDNNGRTYYKNGENDFKITKDGTYKIYFSSEYTWSSLHSTFTLVDDGNSLYANSLPSFISETSVELETPILSLDKENECIIFDPIENATYYEYIIDNDQIVQTTSTNIPLYVNSYITVRACSDNGYFTSSRWSTPIKNVMEHYDNNIYVYFYGSSRPSQMIEKGTVLTRPVNNPTKEGYKFVNWYEDIAHKTVFDFSLPLYENTIIYAKWEYLNEVEYELYLSDKTQKIADFDISKQYSFNEYVAKYTIENDKTLYVKEVDTNKFFGPYVMDDTGDYVMYFSSEHKWDLGTENERNAYWTKDGVYTIYFSNNKFWNKVNYYVWDSSNNPKSSWPGENMTFVRQNSHGEDIYKCSFDTKFTNIIFNNNSEQTVDISLIDIPSGTGFYLDKKNSQGKWQVLSYTYSN